MQLAAPKQKYALDFLKSVTLMQEIHLSLNKHFLLEISYQDLHSTFISLGHFPFYSK